MESEYENSPLEENSDLPASYGDDNPDDGEMDMESFMVSLRHWQEGGSGRRRAKVKRLWNDAKW